MCVGFSVCQCQDEFCVWDFVFVFLCFFEPSISPFLRVVYIPLVQDHAECFFFLLEQLQLFCLLLCQGLGFFGDEFLAVAFLERFVGFFRDVAKSEETLIKCIKDWIASSELFVCLEFDYRYIELRWKVD